MGFWGLVKTGFIVTKIGAKASVNIAKGAINTASDVAQAGNALLKGDGDKLGKIVESRVTKVVNGLEGTVESAVYVADRALTSLSGEDNSPFLDKTTQKHLERLASVAVISAVGASCIDYDSDPDFHDHDGLVSDMELSGIENGVFTGSESDLADLIKAGEIHGTDHIDSDDYERDLTARNQFLSSHGYASIPEGYEVHHIVPLCEGGADSPENMVLIEEELHDRITQAHSVFYCWNKA